MKSYRTSAWLCEYNIRVITAVSYLGGTYLDVFVTFLFLWHYLCCMLCFS